MKQIIVILIMVLCISCAEEDKQSGITTINLEPHLKDTTHVLASELGKTIRYVPLETGDSTTFISSNPIVRQWKNRLIVYSTNNVLKVFDATTGKYLNSIGEISKGPRGNSKIGSFYVNPKNGNVYINSLKDKNIKKVWDIYGNFLRTVTFPTLQATNSSILMPQVIDDKGRFLVPTPLTGSQVSGHSVAMFMEGDTVASKIIAINTNFLYTMDDIESVNVFGYGTTILGEISQQGLIIISIKDNNITEFGNAQTLWKHKDKIYYKAQYKDTVYQLIDTVLQPAIHFDMGRHALAFEDRFKKDNKNSWVSHVYENDEIMLLEWFHEGMKIGIYNKADKTISAGKFQNGIKDNINNFIPLTIHTMNDAGDFIAIVNPLDIVDWNEANPDKKSPLPTIDENANIIIAFIE